MPNFRHWTHVVYLLTARDLTIYFLFRSALLWSLNVLLKWVTSYTYRL
jgi:hypothetical protein